MRTYYNPNIKMKIYDVGSHSERFELDENDYGE